MREAPILVILADPPPPDGDGWDDLEPQVTAIVDNGKFLALATADNMEQLLSEDGVQCVGFSRNEVIQMVETFTEWLAATDLT